MREVEPRVSLGRQAGIEGWHGDVEDAKLG
jgi:hypothetical protein